MINLGTLPLGGLGGEVELEAAGAAAGASERKPLGPCVKAALAMLIEEADALSGGLRAVLEELHRGEAPSGGRRALLRGLARLGPQTVPALARSRGVTRQHIQVQVNALHEQGLVALDENPAHKRSPLARLTKRGEATLLRMTLREAKVFRSLALAEAASDLEQAAATLRTVRESLERA